MEKLSSSSFEAGPQRRAGLCRAKTGILLGMLWWLMTCLSRTRLKKDQVAQEQIPGRAQRTTYKGHRGLEAWRLQVVSSQRKMMCSLETCPRAWETGFPLSSMKPGSGKELMPLESVTTWPVSLGDYQAEDKLKLLLTFCINFCLFSTLEHQRTLG